MWSTGRLDRANASVSWSKVNGYSENVAKNTAFVITLWDLSGTVSTIDFVNVAWRPDSDDTTPSPKDSPFSSSDFDEMIRGKVLQSNGNEVSCGCGSGGNNVNGNSFSFGTYTFKNSGAYEVTIEARITVGGQRVELKCDPKIIVGT